MHYEGSADAGRAFNRETSAVPVEHMLDQRQPQPGSTLRATVGYVDAIKAFCEPWQMFSSDARTVVTYRHARFRVTRARLSVGDGDVDPLASSTIFERVFNEVFECADQFVAVTEHDKGIRRRHLDLDTTVTRQRLQAVDDLTHDRRKIDRGIRL